MRQKKSDRLILDALMLSLEITGIHCFQTLSGHIEIVKLLVENGAEVDVKDSSDNTPLHAAANECFHRFDYKQQILQ